MLIEELTEVNYKEKIKEGANRVDEKIKHLQRQIKNKDFNWFLLLDPTLWAYYMLTDKQGNPFKLRGFQDKIINDRHPFVLCAAANQSGKTHAACIKIIHHAFFVPNASVLVISRSDQQAIYILDEIKWMLQRANLDFKPVISDIENRTEFHIKNHGGKGVSVIRVLPPTERILAYPATLVVPDEIGFWNIERIEPMTFYERVIISRIQETVHWKPVVNGVNLADYFTMGQVFCISSTNAQQGIMWSLWQNKDYHQYRYCWLANPLNTIEKWNQLKKDKSSDVFDSVYAASFSSATGGFITAKEYDDAVKEFEDKKYEAVPSLTVPLYFGGDVAGEDTVSRDVDSSVLIGGIKVREEEKDKAKVEYTNEFPLRSKKEVLYGELERFKSNTAQFAYDKMGVGDSIKNDLIDRNIFAEYQIEALTYSLPNKSDVYYNLKHLFEQRKILLPPGLTKLREQLLGLRFERTQGGHLQKPQIKIHHERESMHDDWADALANFCWAAMRGSAVPVHGDFVSHEKSKEKPKKEVYKNKGNYIPCPKCEDYYWSNREHECITI